MQSNFTFREQGNEQIHSHRLMYVHASAADRSQVCNVRRFKTQPEEEMPMRKLGERQYLSGSKGQNAQITRYSSQRKIKYFDLDLKNLVSNASDSSSLMYSEKNKSTDLREQSTRNSIMSNVVQQKQKVSPFQALGNQSEKRGLGHNKQNVLKMGGRMVKKGDVSHLKEMDLDGLVNEELVNELWRGVGGTTVKKANMIQSNSSEFKEKYNKLNRGNGKCYPKILTPKCFRQKAANVQEMRELCVRRVQKIVVDGEGHQYRITVQKLK